MRVFFIFFTMFVFFTSCQKSKDKVYTIFIAEDEDLRLSDFIEDVSFISLPELINGYYFDKFIESKEFYILADIETSLRVFILTKEFELISIINKYGEGPDQYTHIINIAFDEESQIVEILTIDKILRYTLNGEFVNSTVLPVTWIQNLIHESKSGYIIYVQSQSDEINSTTDFLVRWSPTQNALNPIIKHRLSEVVRSFKDVNNLTMHKDTLYGSHIFLDTIYTIHKGYLGRIFIKFQNENLSLDQLSYEMLEDQKSIIDSDRYSYHFPRIIVSDKFLLSSFVTNNKVKFFILNRFSKNVIAGRRFEDDMNLGIESILPIHLDKKGYLYTIHQFEDVLERAKKSKLDSKLAIFINSLEKEPNFVVARYKLKNF